jgi:hypothetical protein
MRSNYYRFRELNEAHSTAISQIQQMLGGSHNTEHIPARLLVNQAIHSASDQSNLDEITTALNIPASPSESLSDKICALITFRIEHAKSSFETRRFRLWKSADSR